MSIQGLFSGNNSYGLNSVSNSGFGGGSSSSSSSQVKQAEAVAEEGFQQTLAARRITNKYAAAKEIR